MGFYSMLIHLGSHYVQRLWSGPNSIVFKWYSSYSLVQPCLSQERQNVIYVDILEQITQTIYLEKSFSDESKSSTVYKNMFNDTRYFEVVVNDHS